jgi:DNA polymerase phi
MSRKRQREGDSFDIVAPTITQKKRRAFTEQDQKLAKLYNDLADNSNEVRLNAATELLLELSPAKEPNPDVIDKVLRRLLRGLCSGRKAARYGFFIALTELLRQLFSVDSKYHGEGMPQLNGLLLMVDETTKSDGQASGQVRASDNR